MINILYSIGEVLHITYNWYYGLFSHLSGQVLGFRDHTVVDWASFCREVAVDAVMVHSEQKGGPGEEKEIDESKFGKRKWFVI